MPSLDGLLLGALADSASMVPLFLAALLLVRALPALLHRPLLDARETLVDAAAR